MVAAAVVVAQWLGLQADLEAAVRTSGDLLDMGDQAQATAEVLVLVVVLVVGCLLPTAVPRASVELPASVDLPAMVGHLALVVGHPGTTCPGPQCQARLVTGTPLDIATLTPTVVVVAVWTSMPTHLPASVPPGITDPHHIMTILLSFLTVDLAVGCPTIAGNNSGIIICTVVSSVDLD